MAECLETPDIREHVAGCTTVGDALFLWRGETVWQTEPIFGGMTWEGLDRRGCKIPKVDLEEMLLMTG
eukprot:15332680-Ditylum_brightwellii.AAC.1